MSHITTQTALAVPADTHLHQSPKTALLGRRRGALDRISDRRRLYNVPRHFGHPAPDLRCAEEDVSFDDLAQPLPESDDEDESHMPRLVKFEAVEANMPHLERLNYGADDNDADSDEDVFQPINSKRSPTPPPRGQKRLRMVSYDSDDSEFETNQCKRLRILRCEEDVAVNDEVASIISACGSGSNSVFDPFRPIERGSAENTTTSASIFAAPSPVHFVTYSPRQVSPSFKSPAASLDSVGRTPPPYATDAFGIYFKADGSPVDESPMRPYSHRAASPISSSEWGSELDEWGSVSSYAEDSTGHSGSGCSCPGCTRRRKSFSDHSSRASVGSSARRSLFSDDSRVSATSSSRSLFSNAASGSASPAHSDYWSGRASPASSDNSIAGASHRSSSPTPSNEANSPPPAYFPNAPSIFNTGDGAAKLEPTVQLSHPVTCAPTPDVHSQHIPAPDYTTAAPSAGSLPATYQQRPRAPTRELTILSDRQRLLMVAAFKKNIYVGHRRQHILSVAIGIPSDDVRDYFSRWRASVYYKLRRQDSHELIYAMRCYARRTLHLFESWTTQNCTIDAMPDVPGLHDDLLPRSIVNPCNRHYHAFTQPTSGYTAAQTYNTLPAATAPRAVATTSGVSNFQSQPTYTRVLEVSVPMSLIQSGSAITLPTFSQAQQANLFRMAQRAALVAMMSPPTPTLTQADPQQSQTMSPLPVIHAPATSRRESLADVGGIIEATELRRDQYPTSASVATGSDVSSSLSRLFRPPMLCLPGPDSSVPSC